MIHRGLTHAFRLILMLLVPLSILFRICKDIFIFTLLNLVIVGTSILGVVLEVKIARIPCCFRQCKN